MVPENGAKRYLVLADIHSNEPALRAVLDDASHRGPYDGKLCAGDVVGYGPNPNECIEIVKSEGFITVLGNHDRAVRGGDRGDLDKRSLVSSILQGRMLSGESRKFLESLRSKPYVDSEGRFAMVHGSFEGSEDDGMMRFEDCYIVRESDAVEAMRYLKLPSEPSHPNAGVKLGIFGHTHIPAFATGWTDEHAETGYTRVGEDLRFWNRPVFDSNLTEAMRYVVSLKIISRDNCVPKPSHKPIPSLGELALPIRLENRPSEPGNWRPTVLFNPGSVGQPRHGSPAACYGIVEFALDGMATLVFRDVEYDVAETQKRMRDKNLLSDFLLERLEYGL